MTTDGWEVEEGFETRFWSKVRAIADPVIPEPMITTSASLGRGFATPWLKLCGPRVQNEEVVELWGTPGSEWMRLRACCLAEAETEGSVRISVAKGIVVEMSEPQCRVECWFG